MFARPVATWKCNYDYEGHEDLAKVIRQQFDSFVEKHIHLAMVDYIVVKTGYTTDLIRSDLSAFKDHVPLVIFGDSLDFPLIRDVNVFHTVRKVCNEGCLVFDESFSDSIFFLISYLNDVNYCRHCCVECFFEATWYLVDDQMILVAYVECFDIIDMSYF
jgi:hypothetical protein